MAAPSGPKSEDPGPNFLFATPRPFLSMLRYLAKTFNPGAGQLLEEVLRVSSPPAFFPEVQDPRTI